MVLLRMVQALFGVGLWRFPPATTGILVSMLQIDELPGHREVQSNQIVKSSRRAKRGTLVRAMNTALRLWAQGDYRSAVNKRVSAVEASYEHFGLDPLHHIPPALGTYYSAHIGHIALAGAIAHGRKTNHVSSVSQIQLIDKVGNLEAVEALSDSFVQLRAQDMKSKPDSLFFNWARYGSEPLFWTWVQRVDTIPGLNGLEDLYVFLERLGAESPVQREKGPFRLRPDYESFAEQELRKLGVLPTDTIVALHIRETPGNPRDHRLPDPRGFDAAVNYLLGKGIKVVRFGSDYHSALAPVDGLIDLVANYQGSRSLDCAVIQRSDFLVSTLSGPACLANWMGVPALITNVTSIGRNTLSGVEHNRYLPKRFLNRSGRVLSLSETLASPLAYWEGLHSAVIPEDPPTLNSSSAEILDATAEMLELVSGGSDPFELLHNRARQIRRESEAISFGKFSGSFLSANEDWIV